MAKFNFVVSVIGESDREHDSAQGKVTMSDYNLQLLDVSRPPELFELLNALPDMGLSANDIRIAFKMAMTSRSPSTIPDRGECISVPSNIGWAARLGIENFGTVTNVPEIQKLLDFLRTTAVFNC